LVDYIRNNIPAIQVVKPEGTYLGWLDCRKLFTESGELSKFLIEEAKVGLNDGLSFGRQGAGFARINFGCPRSLLQDALERIERSLALYQLI